MRRIEIRDEPPRRLFAVAHRGPYDRISTAFARLEDALAEHGLRAAAREMIGVYYDDPAATPPEELRSHAAVGVGPGPSCPPGLEEIALPGGRHAVVVVEGPYDGLAPAYAWLYGEGLAAAGLALGPGASFEIYRNMPGEVPPEALVTEICAPLA